ncbi:hypothetical protein OHT57_22440 [Streptomyces sp. NBC_00285]|uniref:hypothetical protein n=1 Tax=Streptomyces sp. NBC_00285 TaxID=2975700 RepID=UPI002E2D9C2A|nr:hypothetical protein [Streptomyces sp. NBC_00285]
MESKSRSLMYGLRAKGWLELLAAGASGAGCVMLLIAGALDAVSPWWCAVAVPVGAFNAVEIAGFVLARQGYRENGL